LQNLAKIFATKDAQLHGVFDTEGKFFTAGIVDFGSHTFPEIYFDRDDSGKKFTTMSTTPAVIYHRCQRNQRLTLK
jgi:hypothetical protein